MTMEDWAKRLDGFLNFIELEVLQGSGKVSMEAAKQHAESEFEKYRIVQDYLFESDFDKSIKALLEGKNTSRHCVLALSQSGTKPLFPYPA